MHNIVYIRNKSYGNSNRLFLVTVQDKKSVLLLQDMFPTREKYITNQYIRGGQSVKIADVNVIAEIERSARRVAILLRKGVKFTPTQPNVLRIKTLMLDESADEKNLSRRTIFLRIFIIL